MIHLFSEKFPLKYNIPGIYYIQINSHSYVGSSNQITRRLREHKKKLTHNYHDNKFMQRAYNKYKDGSKIYNSIADAARGICEPQDNFNSICASISGICRNKGKLVKHRYKCKYL